MAAASITPIRLDADTLRRIDSVVARLKSNRSQVIRLLLDAGLTDLERTGTLTIPLADAPGPPLPRRQPVNYRKKS